MKFFEGELPILSARMHLPVVCLDLDGVLNPITAERPEGFVEHWLEIPASDLPEYSPFLRGHGQEDLALSVLVSAALGEWIEDLRKRADVYWSTTWENAANSHYAPLLGIESLPVIEHSKWPYTFSDVKNGDVAHWKHYALNDLFANRALVWVDDRARATDIKYWRGKTPTLVITPEEWVGLTQEHLERIDEFVDKHIGLAYVSETTIE